MTTDHFAHKAASYETQKDRVDNVAQIGRSITDTIALTKSMRIMDFGSGTGLLLERIAPHVQAITAVDISTSMNGQLRDKKERVARETACELEIIEMDLEQSILDRKFDGIISSMTLHHIKNIPALFAKFHSMLNPSGFIALADLDREDGSFHSENTGVYHTGFDREIICKQAIDAKFKNVAIATASVVNKAQGTFPVFLLTGYRD